MIQVYSPNNTNYSKNGDVVLLPEMAEINVELNGAWAATLSHPIDEEGRWEYLVDNAVVKMPSWNGEQLFRIRMKDKSDLDGIYCDLDPIFFDAAQDCFLEDIRPTQKNGQQALDIMTAVNTKYSGVSNISVVATAYYEYMNLLEAISGEQDNSFLNRWGGEIEYDNFTIRINSRLGSNNGVEFRYGRNIQGVTESVDMTEVVTRIYPKAFNGRKLSTKYVDSSLINSYPTVRAKEIEFDYIMYKDDVTEEYLDDPNVIICNTQAELDAALGSACQYQFDAGIDKPVVTISIDGIVPDFVEFQGVTLGLGDTVYLRHPVLDIVTEARIVALTYDAIREEVTGVTIGSVAYNYFNQVSSAVARIETAVRPDGSVRADVVSGVVDMKKANLYAQYDQAEAQDVIGILFENNDSTSQLYGAMAIGTQGFMIADTKDASGNWVFNTWGTAKGLNANYINAGTISANLIAAHSIGVSKLSGTIANGLWELDLDNGTFTIGEISANNIKGGTLTLGGSNNVNGSLTVKDANGNTIGTWNKDGISILSGTMQGANITLGGLSDQHGLIRMLDDNNNEVGVWENGLLKLTGEFRSYFNSSNQDHVRFWAGSIGYYLDNNHTQKKGDLGVFSTSEDGITRNYYALRCGKYADSSGDGYVGVGTGEDAYSKGVTIDSGNNGLLNIHYSSMSINGKEAKLANVKKIMISSFSSLPKTITDSRIRSSHVVVDAYLSNPAAQVGDWTISTDVGSLVITGTINGNTTMTLVLAEAVEFLVS